MAFWVGNSEKNGQRERKINEEIPERRRGENKKATNEEVTLNPPMHHASQARSQCQETEIF